MPTLPGVGSHASSAAKAVLEALRAIGLAGPEEPMVVLTDEPKIPGYLCAPSDAAASRFDLSGVHGQGFHLDDTFARIKSVAECLERLCLWNPQVDSWVIGAYGSGARCDPALFRSPALSRSVGEGSSEDVRAGRYRWWPVTDLASGTETAIPAQLVFLSGVFQDEPAIRPEQISTGAALGAAGTAHAFAAGLFEVLERDACIPAYLRRAPVPRIVDLEGAILDLVDYFRRYELEPHVFDVTTDLGIPTVMVLTLDRTGLGPAVNVGSRAAVTYEDAIRDALLESIHCRRTMRMMKEIEARHEPVRDDQVTSLEERFYYWYPPERIDDLAFWLETERTVRYAALPRAPRSPSEAVATLRARGYHVFVADITLPEVGKLGFEVLKVVVPELHPLYLDEGARCLSSVHHGTIPDDRSLKPHPFT